MDSSACEATEKRFPQMVWDVFCRVIDNYGDVGVCWRLARDLAQHGQHVRLWIDDTSSLQWMAPSGHPGVQLIHWNAQTPLPEPGDVVLETFGCDPNPEFVGRMSQRETSPVWINLEYLSAEDYVERSHGLRSPQAGGLNKWFFYPGFTTLTGGLIHEHELPITLDFASRVALLSSLGIELRGDEILVSAFCYGHARLAEFLAALPTRPTLLLTAPGAATHLAEHCALPPHIRHHSLNWLSQTEYDTLLSCCDLNIVRGEDSFVRAQWAGQPFLWHIYFQDDGAHQSKLNAFLDRYLSDAPPGLAGAVRTLMHRWNGIGSCALDAWPDEQVWKTHTLRWRNELLGRVSLTEQLLAFVLEKR